MATTGRGRRLGTFLLWLAWLVGSVGGAIGAQVLYRYDSSCPQWDDEGRSAAPGSLYAQLMCSDREPPFTWAVAIGIGIGLVLTIVLLRQPRRDLLGSITGALALLLVPAVVVGILHIALPRDCFSGRTDGGECARDRATF
jgi:hypothetical protein